MGCADSAARNQTELSGLGADMNEPDERTQDSATREEQIGPQVPGQPDARWALGLIADALGAAGNQYHFICQISFHALIPS